MFGFKKIAAILAALSTLAVTTAIPFGSHNFTNSDASSLTPRAKHAVPDPPHFVVYADNFISGGVPPVDTVQGFNVFAISFLLTSGPFDNALEWSRLPADRRQQIKAQYNQAGIRLVVSCFGATDLPTGRDPVALADTMAAFVKNTDLDGIDVDYEDLEAMRQGTAVQWLISFTRQLRVQLPQSTYIITHAPLAPWFSPGKFPSDGYLGIHRAVGGMIDWYNIQFYNQGEYTTCPGLLDQSSPTWPQSAVFQIGASGVPISKLVIGKPATTADATNGYIDPGTLAQCVRDAKGRGWNAGVMSWQYPHADTNWIKQVRSLSWPV